MTMNIHKICGVNGSLDLLQEGNISSCFIQLYLICPVHAILAAINVYYIRKHQENHVCTLGLIIKSIQLLSALVVLIVVTQIACSLSQLQDYNPVSYYLSLAFIALAWFLTSIYMQLKNKPSFIFCTFLILSWGTTIAQTCRIIIHSESSEHTMNNKHHRVENYGCLVRLVLQTLAVVMLMVVRLKWNSSGAPNKRLHTGIQAEASETDKLLGSEDFRVYYSGLSKDYPSEELRKVDENSGILSRTMFWWVYELMKKGLEDKLKVAEDLYCLPASLSTKHIAESFRRILQKMHKSLNRNDHGTCGSDEKNNATKYLLLKALHKAFGVQYYSIGILKFLGDCLGFAGPLLLHALVSFMENKQEPMEHGYYYAAGLFASTLVGAFISAHYGYLVNKVGLKIRAAVITSVYHKTLAVKSTGLYLFSTGEVVNFMSTDTDRIVNFCQSFHQFWSLPFQVAVSLYLLHQQVGLSFLAGLCFAILLIPINKCLAVKIRKYSENMMEKKDARVKVMNEILYGIRVIKFYAWERMFSSKVHELRSGELKNLKGMKYLDALCVYFWATTPVLISILTFCTYVLLGNTLTAAKVFTSIALFNMLIFPLNVFPWVINGLIEAWVSLNRVNRFLILEELDLKEFYSSSIGNGKMDSRTMILLEDADFTWNSGGLEADLCSTKNDDVGHSNDLLKHKESDGKAEEKVAHTQPLQKINLSAYQGQFIGVIGHVGSGKSSLLSAITADMDKSQGKVYVATLQDGFGLASQEPWIQHATVRENILFGKAFDRSKYQAVLKACALEEDLKILPAHDQTEVGENGVTLSGGQKARISLARAIYQDKEIYLLDDPLAAVDTHVASHIFTHCIMGVLKHKTRILCTHHWKYLHDADVIVAMEHGKVACNGFPNEVLKKTTWISKMSRKKVEENLSDPGLVEEEEKDVGVVKYDVYRSYWQAAGVCLTISILLSLFLMQASRNISDWWLAYWISHDKHSQSTNDTSSYGHVLWPPHASSEVHSDPEVLHATHLRIKTGSLTFYLVVYGGIAFANTVFTFFRAFLFAYGGVKAAQVIHEKLLKSILAAPVSFFDVTPIGRVVNRFSSDTYSIDDSLPFMMNIFLAQLFGVVGTICITCYGLPWFLLVLSPLAFFYFKIQNYYRKTSREVKRFMTVTLSPVYAHFSETLNGLPTIRALRASERFRVENEKRLELNQRANFSGLAASQWLSLHLQMLGVAMVTCVSFIAVLEHHFSSVDPGLVGLAISYALTITNQLSGLVTSFTETEKQMVSVERAMQYVSGVPHEVDGLCIPPLSWPNQGKITFNNVSLIYRPGLPPALRQVTFETLPNEKIGIVGRTGSGKSSLFLVLFKIVSLQSGHVTIDGLDIATLHLGRLRSSLAIIPQDPFLFCDSVRKNVDPTNQFDDAQLWHVLDCCYLKQAVLELGGLEANVGERGRNLSCGQRQLICLARALLTKAKVLCIDEATASVDFETDKLIQKAIRDEFQSSTVLTIAHRIETILDSDRVLVMDKAQVAEFGPPDELRRNKDSLFSTLINETY
ncbi:LOW QUALITY PROTEIN: multidrug resistance-associated protein 7-like [Dendronephthya gigantea]|uniref:LOW QUALITY PROTEIN: multidrug resistance-associated protein 7-like n=1 Tax=Dendronephthya gigantea TaxID=151771 RepID=UPI00106D0E7A|nr:LOW QUALITY PROTEIN: multidrug resistance-associated protein 7-like [Dendronephthya gigantea]